MKIVSSTSGYGLESLGAAFSLAGFDFILWNSQVKPTLDMFYEIKPDILFYEQDDAALEIAKEKYPKTIFYQLNNSGNLPKINRQHANIAQYLGGQRDNFYLTDLGLFTYFLKPQTTEKDLKISDKEFKTIKAWGTPINSVYYVGNLKLEEKKHAMASCRVFYNFSPEDYWNASLNKVIPFSVASQMVDKIEERYIAALNNTSLHAASKFLAQLNFQKGSEQCLIALNNLYAKMRIKI